MWRGLGMTLGMWAFGALALRAVVVPPERCPPVDAGVAMASARAAAGWIDRAQRPDGSYLYEFDRDTGEEVPAYNVVRHAGVTMSLYQFAAAGEGSAMAPAERGLAWMLQRQYRYDDWSALEDPTDGSVDVGASALMLAGLAQRRIATGDGQYDTMMRALSRYLMAMQQADGSFLNSWDRTTNAPDPRFRSKYATGEAFWALAMMHRLFPGEGWDTPTRKVADYLSLHRDEVEEQKFPPWADQWAAYGLAEMAAWDPATVDGGVLLSADNVAYARSLAERFGFLVRAESQRTGGRWSTLIHGRRARAAGMGTWVEALGSLYRLSLAEPRMADQAGKLRERLVCSAGMLAERQVTAAEASGQAHAEVLEGAWFTEGVTRMDDQQHALSGLLRSRLAMGAGERVE
ncbi:MAG: hypothetical protein IT302_02760 [Dehalococcoidia bacterium]|nr:hypothetical protein [Dehalococcoidia bacterium]